MSYRIHLIEVGFCCLCCHLFIKKQHMLISERNLLQPVAEWPLTLYRRIFGAIILLELLFMTDGIIHVYYEKWEPCFVPLFRELGIPVTHQYVDYALYIGMFCAVLFMFDKALPFDSLQYIVNATLLVVYSYLRIIHFYSWNNHYYLNMLVLAIFQFIPPERKNVSSRPLWEYQILQLFYGSVYFFAGLSKISSSWLDGTIAETMILNNGLVIPNVLLYLGGFLLDFLGGIAVMWNCFHKINDKLNLFVQSQFQLFHLHNLVYLFKSIQFFPLHMLFTPLIFLTLNSKETFFPTSPKIWLPRRAVIPVLIVILQALFACRRFFILVDYPWQITEANDIAEFHSQVHQFSWRMKSRTCAAGVHAGGKYPILMSIGIGPTGADPEDVDYLKYTKVYFNKIFAEAEAGIQPLVNRVRRTMPDADPSEISVNLFWWSEINGHPYQLVVNPELNFVGANHLPFFKRPPKTHVESRVVPRSNWIEVASMMTRDSRIQALNVFPFISRPIPDKWIPNPVIGSIIGPEMMPQYIVCIYGRVVVRWERTERECVDGQIIDVVNHSRFFLKFEQESMLLLAFKP
jgi:hypothetical protein